MVYKSPPCRDGQHENCGSLVCTCICHRKLSTESTASIELNVREATNQQFVAVRKAVMRGPICEATASSHNMAKRIANALNRYRPGKRGY